jgi:Sulfotransferase family
VRSLRNWEAVAPCPPLSAASERDDPRIAAMEAGMERRARLFPRMTAMLPSTATSPTECQLFMAYDFKSQIFQAFARVPSYVDWLNHRADLVPCYAYVKRVLKLLQWHCPPTRWRLKNPSHLLFIDALDQVFPDARFVMTHRDVAQVLPSVADLYYELHKAYSHSPDLPAIGADTAGFCELGLRRLIAFREGGNEHRFFDIQFAPFQRDPFPILAQLYDFLGEPLSEEALAAMRQWRETTPRDSGYARTAMAEFGFSPEALRERFGFYSDRFAVAVAA